jgi:putative aldouronate transport system permease protein
MPGVVLAFKFYQMKVPPAGAFFQNTFLYSMFTSEWVGFNNFTYLLKDAPMLIRNTVGYNLLFMVVGVILQVGLAVIINEMRNRKTAKVYHTIAFMPYFVSWIVVMYALYAMIAFNGFFNQVATSLGHDPVRYYSQKQYWPWIFLLANIWKYTGQGSIIYLATLTGFDEQLYEAASIDGASRFKRIWHITLPTIRPTISILLILAIGGILSTGFEQQLLMGNNAILNYSDVLDTYAYRYGLAKGMYSYGTAVGLFKSIVSFILVMSANKITAKLNDSALF